MRILYVEDNDNNIYMLTHRLRRRNYEVVVALDGEQCMSIVGEENPDLIIIDLILPGIDGWETTRQLKSDQSTANIPIIALSASAMIRDREKAFAAGCDDFDTKPVDFTRLMGKIEALLS